MVKRKQVSIGNAADFKDGNGNWVRSYSPEPYVQHTTRAGKLWDKIQCRCKIGGSQQVEQPTYIGCTNGFKDFQEFAEWCQHQYGYLHKEENGRHWQVDKDLKIFGNKMYSPETCIFVPTRINSLLISCGARRGTHPLGVCYDKSKLKLKARCQAGKGGSLKNLGYFECELKAHQAWQKYKVELIRKICLEDEEIRNHLELVPILLAQAQRIEDDLNNGRETM